MLYFYGRFRVPKNVTNLLFSPKKNVYNNAPKLTPKFFGVIQHSLNSHVGCTFGPLTPRQMYILLFDKHVWPPGNLKYVIRIIIAKNRYAYRKVFVQSHEQKQLS